MTQRIVHFHMDWVISSRIPPFLYKQNYKLYVADPKVTLEIFWQEKCGKFHVDVMLSHVTSL